MEGDAVGLGILFVTGVTYYIILYLFLRRGKYPYFVGRPLKAIKYFIILEVLAGFIVMLFEAPVIIVGGQNNPIFGVVAGIVEEIGKLLPIFWLVRRNEYFKEYFKDGGWLYIGIIAGLSFGIYEFVLYSVGLAMSASPLEALAAIAIGRFPVIGLHSVYTAIAAWGYAWYLRGNGKKFAIGLGAAMFMHALYDVLVFLTYNGFTGWLIAVAACVYIVGLIIVVGFMRHMKQFYYVPDKSWIFKLFIVPQRR